MSPIATIEVIATGLWVYAGLGLADWGLRVFQSERGQHIASVTGLLANLVPVMIALVVVVMVGAVIGLPSVVVIIALLFPAGLGFGVHQSLNEMRETRWRFEAGKLALAIVISAAVIWHRQFA
ncbi:hypothetical protein E2K80_02635 [Rhodophyticola sp. CCM32]|uniref:hypothetical protein n=1 Tax=Rhodophyticola sp. CCM32 TaxID=2916397 RepID=UPI00107FB48F|nr:hypothetical protein [Rhodophyticola sp. CCM32]QBX99755.1 hypothetical protein E2K80_02635 [Rhodophyticola sp. CCM32]